MSLSSLIVQREIASIREIEEALARQVLYGGDLVTNLFEVSRVDEASLMPVVAESYGLPPAPPGELPMAPEMAARLVTAEVVAERAFAPLEMGSSLVVAVAEPLSADAEQELTFALALPIEQRIAPLFRIRQALARDYGLPLDKRIARLIKKIVSNQPRVGTSFPPPYHSTEVLRAPPRPPSVGPPPPSVDPPRTEVVVQGTLVRKEEAPPPRPVRRRRGPLTADIAKAELEASAERDVILDVVFEFSRQFFDYTALFVVHGDIAEGRDAFGDGAARDKAARIGVPLDLPNMLTTARKERTLLRTRPSNEGLDPVLMADLERDGATECVVFPIIVRRRVVALLLGDGGISGVDDIGVRQVEKILESASGAFERLIVRRKLKNADAPNEGGVAQAQKKAADSVPPPTQVSAPPVHIESDHPSTEDLAPPIRELLAEPERHAPAPSPPREQPTASALLALDPMAVPSDRPPPANLLAVRRPSGRPIPREEPESIGAIPVARRSPSGPPKSRSTSIKRAEAPPLEFGAPQVPSVTGFGADSSTRGDSRRQLIAQIPGGVPSSEAPHTTRDPEPWSRRGNHRATAEMEPVAFSPKAVSPPMMRAAVPVTDVSPQPIYEAASEAPPDVRASPITPQIDLRGPELADGVNLGATLVAGQSPLPMNPAPTPARRASPIQTLVVVTPDKEFTPVGEVDDDKTPVMPPVAESKADPVLPLAQRKGEPPVLPKSEPKPMPPSEQQVSVPLHKPPSSRSDHSRVLPSVIVDVASEYVALVDRVLAGPDEDAEADLMRAGGYAMPAIMERFPGPITIEPERLESGALPRVGDCGPIIRLIAAQRRTALPFVLTHVQGVDIDKRFWATYLLTELVYPDALEPAIARAFDDDSRIRRAARAALRAQAEVSPEAVVERLGEIAFTQALQRRVQALEALAETREPLAVPVLLPLLEDAASSVSQGARAALVLIAQQDFGTDTERWLQWWSTNRDRHRIEWLIDSLMHDQRALRGSASEELRTITKEYFAYYDDLPKRERERAQARYREWWDTVGRFRFSRASLRGA